MVGQVTASDVPVGVGGTAPTGDHPDSPQSRALLNAVSHARGVLTAEVDTLRRRCGELTRTVEVLLAALDGGEEWAIDNARFLAQRELNYLKDRP